ncbi:PAS domain-containing protein [Geobacter sp. DSM 9736]|uniref:PAS domain-containing protein n=1 Tax=Geobacter sp. DSM 9736 TaxID=1277350 RepID=UPI000B5F91D3|nr:PAS domain-containing protein [Geobacter sp. DSM 9736]SNB45976.1 PAS domain-containing protein [Geobacter sp. DSM 9736]
MDTYFATAERNSADDLKQEIDTIIKNEVVRELLHALSGLIAVLDEHRQVVALNDSFLQMLGVSDPAEVLGLRLGEALHCIHSHEEPHGCGTTKYCATCGAAIATVSALGEEKPAERICALTAERDGVRLDTSLSVRANPIKLEGNRFVLVFLQDITLEELRASLERTFFHDISNMLTGLIGASEMLAAKNRESTLAQVVFQSALRLSDEVAIQKSMFQSGAEDYRVTRREALAPQLLNDLKNVFTSHPASLNKYMKVREPAPQISIRTDLSLALRVMCNMVTNALEATEESGAVEIWFEEEEAFLIFCVWNGTAIADRVKLRIFQRNFSTKRGVRQRDRHLLDASFR